MTNAPRTGRNAPDKDNSPANSWRCKRLPSICPLAAKIPSAMGKSKRPESLGKSAGAKFTVIRWLLGNSKPEFNKAERTRSLASLTSTSAKPTNVKLGKPLAMRVLCRSLCPMMAQALLLVWSALCSLMCSLSDFRLNMDCQSALNKADLNYVAG